MGRRLEAQACPFQPQDAASAPSPCNSPACDGVDWSSPTQQCEAAIASYCTGPHWLVSLRDPECDNWWHTSVECQFDNLDETTVRSLQYAVTHGRSGKGIVYVFASGNSHGDGADVNQGGYTVTRFIISVGSVGRLGKHSSYSTAGAALFVVAPGGDGEFTRSHVVAQPSQGGLPAGTRNQCQDIGVGTSYAAPVVTGVIALMLEANAELSWRDVQGILATTSSATDTPDAAWSTNGAGLHHSYKYGFGVVNASRAVAAAKRWTTYGPEVRVSRTSVVDAEVAQDGTPLELELSVDADSALLTETVYVYLHLNHSDRGDLRLELESPMGTHSTLVPGPRPESTSASQIGAKTGACSKESDTCPTRENGVCDYMTCGCDYVDCGGDAMPADFGPEGWNWRVSSVRAWGERAAGVWKLRVSDRRVANTHETAMLHSWSVFVYGHASPPVLEYPSSCAGGMLGVDNPGGAYSSYAYGTPEPSCDCSFSGTFHVPDWERAIPPFAFAGCWDLTAVTGMANVETVGADAF